MKKLITLSLALLGTVCAQAQTTYPGGISNCIARYDFNSTASGSVSSLPDVSGNGNNSSTVNNLTTTTDFRGRANKAMLFNGTNSAVFVPNAPLLNPDLEVTMVALVRADGFYSGVCQLSEIVSKGAVLQSAGNYYLGISDNRADGENCQAYDPALMQPEHLFGHVYTPQPPVPFTLLNKWYFIAATYNGQETAIYAVPMDPQKRLEGITPYHTAPAGGNMGINTDPLTIGKHNITQYPYWFNGAMDEVALFNRGLSNSEVFQVYSYLWGATLDVANSELLNDINTYPNPAASELNIAGKLHSKHVLLEVYNAMGQKLLTEEVAAASGSLQHRVNTGNLPTGIYTLKLTADGAVKNSCFSVQR